MVWQRPSAEARGGLGQAGSTPNGTSQERPPPPVCLPTDRNHGPTTTPTPAPDTLCPPCLPPCQTLSLHHQRQLRGCWAAGPRGRRCCGGRRGRRANAMGQGKGQLGGGGQEQRQGSISSAAVGRYGRKGADTVGGGEGAESGQGQGQERGRCREDIKARAKAGQGLSGARSGAQAGALSAQG